MRSQKKFLIFGLPRSGTTALQAQISRYFNVPGLNEPFQDSKIKSKYIEWTQNITRGVIKLLTTNMVNDDPIKIDQIITAGNFDCILVTQRQNLTYNCLSYYYAEQVVKQYQWHSAENVLHKKFVCDVDFVKKVWAMEYACYLDTVNWLKQNNHSFVLINFEDYINNKEQTVMDKRFTIDTSGSAFVHSELDYQSLCENWHEIDCMIQEVVNTSWPHL